MNNTHLVINNIKDTLDQNFCEFHNINDWEKHNHEELNQAYSFTSGFIYALEANNKILHSKISLLKELMLLTHECVENEQASELQVKQWNKYITSFPEEA